MSTDSRSETVGGARSPAPGTWWTGPPGAQADRSARIVLGLLLFNALSAMGGGVALMTGLIPEQASWIRHTDFDSLFVPGVILFAVVGGSSAVAALASAKGLVGWQLTTILAGVVMVVWIIGEIAAIRGFHVLQVVYLVTGSVVLWCTPSTRSDAG